MRKRHCYRAFFFEQMPIVILMHVLLLTSPAQARTTLGGTIMEGTFSAAGNPYIIEKTITLPKGAKIVITEGCRFFFKPYTGITVNGSILVAGTTEQPVLFSSINDERSTDSTGPLPNPFDWNGFIIATDAGTVEFSNFKLCYSVYGIKSHIASLVIHNGVFCNNGQFNFTVNDEIKKVIDNISYNYATYGAAYIANNADNGSAPVDATRYPEGAIVKVPENSGKLERAGYSLSSWNSSADGTGEDYSFGSSFVMSTYDVKLYARWMPSTALQQCKNVNGPHLIPKIPSQLKKAIVPTILCISAIAAGGLSAWSTAGWLDFDANLAHERNPKKQTALRQSRTRSATGSIVCGTVSIACLSAGVCLYIQNNLKIPSNNLNKISFVPLTSPSITGVALSYSLPTTSCEAKDMREH